MEPVTQKKTRPFGSIKPNGKAWQLEYTALGRRHWEQFSTRDEAEKYRIIRESEVRKHQFTPPRTEKVKYEQLEQDYRTHCKLNRRGFQASTLRHLLECFSGWLVEQINPAAQEAYAAQRLQEPLGTIKWGASRTTSRSTVAMELAVLRRILRLGYRNGRVPRLPNFASFDAGDTARQVFLDDAEYEAIMAELSRTDIRHPTPYLVPPFEFARWTGWRSGEVKALAWDLVDWDKGYVLLTGDMTKNGEPRKFPFHNLPGLKKLLVEQRERVRAQERLLGKRIPWLFPGRDGDQIKDWQKGWRAAVLRAAVKSVGGKTVIVRPKMVRVDGSGTIRHDRKPHDFRRTAARRLRKLGIDEGTIMKLVGWKTRDMFDRYDIHDDRDLEEGVAKLAAFTGNATTFTGNGSIARQDAAV